MIAERGFNDRDSTVIKHIELQSQKIFDILNDFMNAFRDDMAEHTSSTTRTFSTSPRSTSTSTTSTVEKDNLTLIVIEMLQRIHDRINGLKKKDCQQLQGEQLHDEFKMTRKNYRISSTKCMSSWSIP